MRPARVLAAVTLLTALAAVPLAAQEPLAAGSDGVPVPKKTKHVQPVYPAEALAQGIRGIVILDIVVGTDGKVQSTALIRSVPGLDEAAIAAARQWEYEPVKMDGKPVAVRLTVPITFALALPKIVRDSGIPELRQGASPAWPPGAPEGGGAAEAEVTLEPDGRVGAARITEGDEPWSGALRAALRTWRFPPPEEDAVVSFRVGASFVGGRGEQRRVELKASGLSKADLLAAAQPDASAPTPAAASAPVTTTAEATTAPPLAPPTTPPPAATGDASPPQAQPEGSSVAGAAPGSEAATASTPAAAPAAPASASAPPAAPAASSPAPTAAAPSTPAAPPPAPAAPSAPAPVPAAQAAGTGQPPLASPPAASPTSGTPPPTGPATAGSAGGDRTAPPVEVITAPAPPPVVENGVSAVRDVTLQPGVPDLTRGRRPVSPPVARMSGTTGTVEVAFSVSAAGATTVQTVVGPEPLRLAAQEAVASWVFHRARADRAYLIAVFDYAEDKTTAEIHPQPASTVTPPQAPTTDAPVAPGAGPQVPVPAPGTAAPTTPPR